MSNKIGGNKLSDEYLKCGAKKKFIVLKADGTPTDHEYLVINTDEPYIQDIIEIMKKNGQWG